MPEALPSMLEAAPIAPEAALALFYSRGQEGEGDWQGVVLIVLFYFNIFYLCTLPSRWAAGEVFSFLFLSIRF